MTTGETAAGLSAAGGAGSHQTSMKWCLSENVCNVSLALFSPGNINVHNNVLLQCETVSVLCPQFSYFIHLETDDDPSLPYLF